MSEPSFDQRAVDQARTALSPLNWSGGLTRDDIRTQAPTFPYALWLKLPASKRFQSADEMLKYAVEAGARADGEFGDVVDVAEEREVLDLGGPPAWGDDPLLAGEDQPGGSATDTQGLES